MLTWSVNLNPNRLCPDFSLAGLDAAAETALARIGALGATGVRVDLFWRWLMPEPGSVNREAVDWYRRFFAACERRGVLVYTLLYHPPAWALALLERDEQAFLEAWVAFCQLVTREFGPALQVVQVWNEPNNYLGAFKQDPGLFVEKRLGRLALPVGVRWGTLTALFQLAKAHLPAGSLVTYNVLTNLSPFLPFRGTWLDWEHFTERLLTEAGAAIDVIAIDHYPDTWAPGTGPLEWECLERARAKVNDPASRWHGKTVIVGETGYSTAPNFHLIERPFKWGRFFPGERSEASMASWYGAAASHLARTLTPEHFPHNKLGLVNLYELFDAPRPVGSHPIVKIEDHFGLVRRDGTPKPAYETLRAVAAGELHIEAAEVETAIEPFYWGLARAGQRWQARWRPAESGWVERRVPGVAPETLPMQP